MANPRVTLLFKKLPANYPRSLEKKHGHILDRLMELWGTPEFDPYIDDLLIGNRGKRFGFSLEVVAELMFINELHNIFKSEGYRFPEVTESLPKAPLPWESIPVPNPTPQGFQKASERGKLDEITTFLDAGIAVDYRFENGQTPLIIAAINGQIGVVRSLIVHGAGLNLYDEGKYTALHWAAYYHHGEIVADLIKAGADINVVQNSGDTPLSLAVTRGHLDVVKVLLENRATPNIAENTKSPLAIALRKKNTEMIALLKQYGAES
ncbi:MAG: ankyrin repeat domain-containing protein [Nitrosomonadales bacterium]